MVLVIAVRIRHQIYEHVLRACKLRVLPSKPQSGSPANFRWAWVRAFRTSKALCVLTVIARYAFTFRTVKTLSDYSKVSL